MADVENGKLGVPQQRSPAFPYISLELAVERARQIYREVRDHPQPREVLAKAYGKPATSSATLQTFATLLQYGLLENVTGPTVRKMRISALAQGILNPHAPQEKIRQALKTAALHPPVFGELWSRYGDTEGLNESVLLYYLTNERGHEHGGVFTEKAARDVLRVYRATLAFAGVSGSENNQVTAEDEEHAPLPQAAAKVGDFVQVEINGAFQLKQPKRIESIQEHEGKLWAFLEGERAAVEISNVIVQQAGEHEIKPVLAPTRELPITEEEILPEGWSEERLIDDGGNEIKIRYRGKASLDRYEFIRDYLDFKIQRLTKKGD